MTEEDKTISDDSELRRAFSNFISKTKTYETDSFSFLTLQIWSIVPQRIKSADL